MGAERDFAHGANAIMRIRIVILGAAITAAACICVAQRPATVARLVAQNLTRAEIRSMPIEERPDRPIHFYGNAVRRRHHRAPPAAPVRPAPIRPAPAR